MNPPHDDELDRWLHQSHQDLLDGLDAVLDLDAGLASILPSVKPIPPAKRTLRTSVDKPLTSWAKDFARRPATQRLTRRACSPLPQLKTLHGVLQSADAQQTRDLDGLLSRLLDLTNLLDLARDLAHGIALDLDLEHARTRNLACARDLTRDLDLALDLTDGLIRDYTRDQDLGLARDLAHDLFDDLVSDDEDSAVWQRARNVVAELIGLLNTVLVDLLGAVVRRARHVIASQAGGDDQLVAAMKTADAEDARRAAEVLEAALSDAVDADLSDADLDGVPLTGVVWSSRTIWPPDVAKWVRTGSKVIAPDRFKIHGRPRIGSTAAS